MDCLPAQMAPTPPARYGGHPSDAWGWSGAPSAGLHDLEWGDELGDAPDSYAPNAALTSPGFPVSAVKLQEKSEEGIRTLTGGQEFASPLFVPDLKTHQERPSFGGSPATGPSENFSCPCCKCTLTLNAKLGQEAHSHVVRCFLARRRNGLSKSKRDAKRRSKGSPSPAHDPDFVDLFRKSFLQLRGVINTMELREKLTFAESFQRLAEGRQDEREASLLNMAFNPSPTPMSSHAATAAASFGVIGLPVPHTLVKGPMSFLAQPARYNSSAHTAASYTPQAHADAYTAPAPFHPISFDFKPSAALSHVKTESSEMSAARSAEYNTPTNSANIYSATFGNGVPSSSYNLGVAGFSPGGLVKKRKLESGHHHVMIPSLDLSVPAMRSM